MDHERFVITTSIPYVNAKPHIGFLLEVLYADVLARFYRAKIGDANVRFLSGTDEHGQKIQRKAAALKKEPQDFVDAMSQEFRLVLQEMHISNDDFIRTSEERHIRGAQEFWRRMDAHGFIVKREFEGLYCVGCEEYKTEKDLIAGKCPVHDVAPELLKEKNYFFLLSKFEGELTTIFEKSENFVVPEHRKNEVLEFVNRGLHDIPISRPVEKLSWGIPVPDDPSQVMYVWVEAITNYLNALGFGMSDEWNQWWPWTRHIIGKDINRFHSVMWPAMLIATGINLPQQIAVHGFITVEGRKMSKSLGNVIAPAEVIGRYGVDATRYLFMAAIPFAGDGDFTWERFDELYTAELTNGIGNLFSRVTTMVGQYCGGRLMVADTEKGQEEQSVDHLITLYQFDEALKQITQWVQATDVLLEENKPWLLAKKNPQAVEPVLAQAVVRLRSIAHALLPFMPEIAQSMNDILHAEKITKPARPLFPRLKHKK